MRLTYANVTATLALFIALGGTSYAVTKLPSNSVGTPQLRKNAVTGVKIKDGTIDTADLTDAARGTRGPRGEAGPAGAAGPPGAAGRDGLSSARVATRGLVSLSRNVGVPVEVARMDGVAAGSYLILFTTEARWRENGVGMYVTCNIRVNGTSVSSIKGIVGDAYGGDEAMADTMPVERSTPFDLTVSCQPDQSSTSLGTGPRVESVKLVALRMNQLSTDSR